MISRLNAVLSVYQRKYLPVRDEEVKSEDPLHPWLSDSSVLSPLLVEYDNTIRNLKNELVQYKKEQASLKERISEVVHENGKMLQERRLALEREMGTGKTGMEHEKTIVDSSILNNVQHQLEIATKERDYNSEMLEKTSQELEDLHRVYKEATEELASKLDEAKYLQNDLLKARRFAEQLQVTNRKLQAEYDQFLTTAKAQDHEVESARDDIRRYKTEVKALSSENEDLKRRLNALQGQTKLREKDKALLNSKEQDVESRLEEYRTKVIELESRLVSALSVCKRVQEQNNVLEERVEDLLKKNLEQERVGYEASKHVRDSMQLVENAVLERDQVLVREKQKTEEVNRLQEVIQKLLHDAGTKTKLEVSKVKNHCNKNLQKLMEELQYMEMEGAEKQAQLERALREKGAVEKELEKIYQEGPSEITRTGMTFEQLQKKIIIAEKTKEEALQARESLTSLVHKMEKKHDQQKTQLLLENEDLKKRVKQLILESEDIAANRLILIDEIDTLKRELLLCQTTQEQVKQKSFTEVASLEQRHKVKERQFEEKLRSVEGMNARSVNELREMLTAQQRMGFKWKEESQVLSKKFEETVTSLRNEISKQSKRNDATSRELVEAKRKSKQMEDNYLSTKALLEKAQSIAADAKTRAEAASKQVETLLNRERQLLEERKNLHKELEKARLRKSRPSSIKRFADGLSNGSFASQRVVRDSDNVTNSTGDRNRNLEFDRETAGHSIDGYYHPKR
ncbi:sodium channel and clathrin linker 1-like isoform X2 [Dendronephthya gigantea]|uniref:sodium channel and clathrin linker 1-like isoform X2 n=1 Tax=Dendronephthya gigantea TaxID=151771 RepID=UPI001068DD43|nr:sodium channel and clathrin linker 1-like isoform X2 [Dendronephthya gigantea]